MIFNNSFRFSAKLSRKYRVSIYPLPPGMLSLPHYQYPLPGRTFVAMDEPILTHYHHPASTPRVYITVPLGAGHSTGLLSV